jgi:DNA-3-methyladenine glycosylase
VKRLTRPFFERDSLSVARDLIGCIFVHRIRTERLAVRLVEVEAYRGDIDPGSHGYRGMTPRTEVMFGPPGRLYVYFTYGMHYCANVVCGPPGVCEAVLLRAGEPTEGIDAIRSRRPGIPDRLLAAGPARLAVALGIGKEDNGASLLRGGEFWLAEDEETDFWRSKEIAETVRIGLGPGKGDELPWRFVIPGHTHASRRT